MLELRDYQIAALTDIYRYFERERGNPLAVIPTGGGKSLLMAEWIKGVLAMAPTARIVIVTHVRELVAQNHAELIGMWPEAPAGIYSAGLRKRQLGSRILFCSIQSVHRKALQIQQCDMLLIDEAHLVPKSANTMYGRFITELREINPAMKVIGFTATPFRLDSGMLHQGEGAIFTHIAHDTSARLLIDKGYLAPLISRQRHDQEMDTEGVHTRGGEFVAAELEERAIDPDVIRKIVADIVANGQGRRGWLVFGTSIRHCELMADELREHGVTCAVISAETPDTERERVIDAYKRQEIRCLVSMGVLTTGFNAKHVDLIALARATQSTGLYIQMVGRGTRCMGADIHESRLNGKADCLVLDYGGNIRRHGPFDEPFIPQSRNKGKGDGEAPVKECPQCENSTFIGSLFCAVCGYEFPPPERKVTTEADFAPILAPPPAWLDVDDVSYSRHERPGRPAMLRVVYRCGMTFYSEWVCLEHDGYARRKATGWWKQRAYDLGLTAPDTVAEAITRIDAGDIARPDAIRVKRDGKYDNVTDHRFSDENLPRLRTREPGLWLSQPERPMGGTGALLLDAVPHGAGSFQSEGQDAAIG